jgi:hypothetical protein
MIQTLEKEWNEWNKPANPWTWAVCEIIIGNNVCNVMSKGTEGLISLYCCKGGTRSVVVKALSYKPEGCRFETWGDEWIFSIYLNLLVTLGLGAYLASNRN